MTRIALNGLGRIGKLALRDLIDTGAGGEIVLLNDPVGDAEQHALLMEFDSVHGRWKTPVSYGEAGLNLNGQPIRLTHERTIEALPLRDLGVDLVIDLNGVKGFNQVTLDRTDFKGTGVMKYQLKTANNTATKSMIIVE